MTRYEAREIAIHLIDGGWRAEDKAQFIEENEKQEEENVLALEDIDTIWQELESIEAQ